MEITPLDLPIPNLTFASASAVDQIISGIFYSDYNTQGSTRVASRGGRRWLVNTITPKYFVSVINKFNMIKLRIMTASTGS
ncbi:hypothetical protein AGABI1DRAFT_110897 [Agaricus bisporus var. burnettii JB137-S8]|uniref:Uncharacterized protein n=1 Tax=Agaricus bisporus var. burnettii (strain JB137-S8 / ATCC MYA-4627 / FGSC 10392) TaxID=597362 RepID=K5XLC5_AGABU|nr:uncharacterized protein AGABI1DRAFT_110897 [Agaricus bisporus var. burnettii JB137-S8]EKM84373.1 hypothetical protein AGABI1DRAFT_110897 [Agaricus bisporus var. burnettii JB137-S8]